MLAFLIENDGFTVGNNGNPEYPVLMHVGLELDPLVDGFSNSQSWPFGLKLNNLV